MGGRLNSEWHRSHPMPKKPTNDQRVQWHLLHSEECGCREVPASLKTQVESLRRSRGGRRSN